MKNFKKKFKINMFMFGQNMEKIFSKLSKKNYYLDYKNKKKKLKIKKKNIN